MSKQSDNKWIKEYVALIKERYGPSVLTQTDEPLVSEVVHHSDCHFYKQMHCSCGLLDHLVRMGIGGRAILPKIYPNFFKEILKHQHAREFLDAHSKEIERRMASTHAAFLRKTRGQNEKGKKKLYDMLVTAYHRGRDDNLKVSDLFTDPVKKSWFLRDIEDQIEDLFYETKVLRNTPDMFTLIGEMKCLLWRVYDMVHISNLKNMAAPAVDLTSEGCPSLVWLNAKNSKMLRCFYDLSDDQLWINLSDIYTGKGHSRIFNQDKDFLRMMHEFLEIHYPT